MTDAMNNGSFFCFFQRTRTNGTTSMIIRSSQNNRNSPKFLQKVRNNPLVEGAFYGLRPASIAMITVAGLNVAKVSLIDLNAFNATGAVGDLFVWKALILGVILFIALRKLKWHPVMFIAISAAVGIIFRF